MKWLQGLLICSVLFATACKKSNTASTPPEISLITVAPTTKSLSNEDSVFIYLRIIDANSDLGVDTPGYDVYLIDKRSDTTYYTNQFRLPIIPDDLRDPTKKFEATAMIYLDVRFFPLREDDTARVSDTMKFEIYMFDRDKNESNHITTPEIYIVP